MSGNDRKLLLKDICARIPYGVRADGYINAEGGGIDISSVRPFISGELVLGVVSGKVNLQCTWVDVSLVRPYLRPLSGMTAKEMAEYHRKNQSERIGSALLVPVEDHLYRTQDCIDWLLKHHFDCNGLIGRGLAETAPKGMYNNY